MRTLDIDPYAAEPALLKFIVGLERARRRFWPQFGRIYEEPTVAFDGRLWTLDEIWGHLAGDTDDCETEARDERDFRATTTLRLRS